MSDHRPGSMRCGNCGEMIPPEELHYPICPFCGGEYVE